MCIYTRLLNLLLTSFPAFTVPPEIGFTHVIANPAVPAAAASIPSRYQPPQKAVTSAIGIGPDRVYKNPTLPNFGHPLRVPPGSVADMDVIMEHCDFSENKVCNLILHPYAETLKLNEYFSMLETAWKSYELELD